MRCIFSMLFVLFLLVGPSFGQSKAYPQPQTSSAAGQLAPDFSLKDQTVTLLL